MNYGLCALNNMVYAGTRLKNRHLISNLICKVKTSTGLYPCKYVHTLKMQYEMNILMLNVNKQMAKVYQNIQFISNRASNLSNY